MQQNLIFLSGPHGSGKTTLAKELGKLERVLVPELFSRNVKFDTNPDLRLLLKICGRSIEGFEYMQLAGKNPDKLVLGNRCIYDQDVYNRVYARKGWISQSDVELANVLSRHFYASELRQPWAVILNPGFDVCLRHLEKRWQEKGKKWREDDSDYLRFACEEYSKLKENDKVFYIDHEVDLVTKREIRDAYDWAQSLQGVLV